MIFTTSVQSKMSSEINRACAAVLCEVLGSGGYSYNPRVAQNVSQGMVYEGDELCCNCFESNDCDHPLNLFAKFCSHSNDLSVMTIHSDEFDVNDESHTDPVFSFMKQANYDDNSTAFIIDHSTKSERDSSRLQFVKDLVQKLASLLWLFVSIKPVYLLYKCGNQEEIFLLSPLDGEWILIEADSVEHIFDYDSWRF